MNSPRTHNFTLKNLLRSVRVRRIIPVVALTFVCVPFLTCCAQTTPACCQITAIDQRTGIATAKVNAAAQAFEFRLTNPALLQSLRVGEPIYANFTTHQVSLDGKNPCGTIVAVAPAKGAAPLPQPGTSQGPGGTAPRAPSAPNLSNVMFRPALTLNGVGNAPCGAAQIPGLAGPIPPSAAALDPVSAVNELQSIVWTNFSKQATCDAVSQLLAQTNQNLSPPQNQCTATLECWNVGAVIQDVQPEVDISAAPGIRYACLIQQDCPAGAAPGFGLDVPAHGPGWKVGVKAKVGYNIHAEQDYKNPITGDVHKINDLLNCGFTKDVDVALSNIKLSETTIFNATDLSRPTVLQASISAHITLSLGGAIYTNGPQDLNLKVTINKSGQITFTNPAPISAKVNLIDACGVAELPAHVEGLGVSLAWDQAKQQVTANLFGTVIIEILGRTIAIKQPVEMTQTLQIPAGLLQALEQGLPRSWGENPPPQFWTQPAGSVDFAAAAKQIESAIVPHIPWGAVLSIDHSAPARANLGQTISSRFGYQCPPSPSATTYTGKLGKVGTPMANMGAAECYRTAYDSAIHTGEYLTAEAFRYAATHSPDALTRVKQVLNGNGNGNGIARLFWVTEDAAVSKDGRTVPVSDGPGLFSRTAFPSDSPLPLGDSSTGTVPGYKNCYYLRPEGGWKAGARTFPTYSQAMQALMSSVSPQAKMLAKPTPIGRIWYGLGCGEGDESPLSRDQYLGIFMGLAYTHALVPDPEVQATTRDLLTSALTFLIKNNWDVRVAPDRRIPLDSNFLRTWDYQLSFLRIGASVNPTAVMPNGVTLAKLYQAYAAGSKVSWIPTWATMLEPLTGGGFAANLSHAAIAPTLFLESDPGLRQDFMPWFNMLRRATQHHKNAYFDAVNMLVGGAAPSQKPSPSNPNLTLQDEFKGILQEWLKRRDAVNAGNGLPLNFVADPSYQVDLFNRAGVAFYTALTGDQHYLAKYPLPIYARNGDGLDFAWQRDPFDIAVQPPSAAPPAGCSAQLPFTAGTNLLPVGLHVPTVTAAQIFNCGSDHANQEGPGADYLLPYWIGVYLKLLPAPTN